MDLKSKNENYQMIYTENNTGGRGKGAQKIS